MAPSSSSNASAKGGLTWRPTKIMNMRDLSKDDDYLSHLLVEKLGTGTIPLLVHKMDPSRRLPKTPASDLLEIVRRVVTTKGQINQLVNRAVDELLRLTAVRYYLQSYTQKQINAFATHASRYFELYNPGGSIEISHTSRYSHKTGKSELCILATRNLVTGTVITELKGSMANLTDEEDRELKRTDLRHSDIRRDFSVIHSKSMKKNHLFLGPARFVNAKHDCDNNCELFREGRYITFRVIKPIALGEEITAHYGDGYFGRKNRNCLCETCEKKGRGGYAPVNDDDASDSSDSDSDVDDDSSVTQSDDEKDQNVNLDERRTRRGVYAVVTKEDDSDESEDEDEDVIPLAGATDIPSAKDIELSTEADTISELTSLVSSRAPSNTENPEPSLSEIPVPSGSASVARSISSLSSLSSAEDKSPASSSSTPFRSIISTRRQKAAKVEARSAESPTVNTPPRSASTSVSPSKRITRSCSMLTLNGKGKGKATERSSMSATPRREGVSKEDGVNVKKEDSSDSKLLRAKPAASNTPLEPPPKPEPPRGQDGKLLPLCCTCSSVLPVISVDLTIVWGLGMENQSVKKKAKQECPRCMRHAAIYGLPWPRRTPLPGTTSNFLTTPKESTPVEPSRRVTQKGLHDLDRKLAAAALSKKRQRGEEDDVEAEKPAKKSKTDVSESRHEREESEHPTPKRKRGRPRLSTPQRKSASIVVKTEEEEDTPLHPQGFKSQSRHMDGRFGTATTNTSPSRAERALEREKQKERREKEQEVSQNKKRSGDDDDDDGPETKRLRGNGGRLPLRRVFPRPGSLGSGNLVGRPNPLSFATRAWSGLMISDDGSEEDGEGPHTPEDSQSPPAVGVESGDPASLVITAAIPPPLTYKPTPFSFARRRWSSFRNLPSEEDQSELSSSKSAEEDEALPPPKFPHSDWVVHHDVYSSEEEDGPKVFPTQPGSSSSIPSPLSSPDDPDEVGLQFKYPSDALSFRKAASFFSHTSSLSTNLVDAGWD
ncbi:hypothetical protein D9758_001978 [Tetrapyrgos nigripes]|uniref:SET domain-containing protein n=1 Tax=Tetrapyrgos nigripes TaxID=182062 RepID=A0A8H5GTL7_9AGAR|nr:hypothetical protein D9758_001978 [Tetrapyrgos nigripes]